MNLEFSLSNKMPLSLSIKAASEQSSLLRRTYRILIVEDDSKIAALIAKGLQRSGFLTEIVDNGNDVLAKVLSDDFDLMLLDLNLPGKDGRAVLYELRAQGSTLPIIVVTARLFDPQDEDMTGVFANEIVKKPFAMNDLIRKVRVLLQSVWSYLFKDSGIRAGSVAPQTSWLGQGLEYALAGSKPLRSNIMGHIRQGDDVLVAAHGNSLRAIITQLDNLKPEQVPGLELDTGVPMVYTFDGKGSVPQKTVLQK